MVPDASVTKSDTQVNKVNSSLHFLLPQESIKRPKELLSIREWDKTLNAHSPATEPAAATVECQEQLSTMAVPQLIPGLSRGSFLDFQDVDTGTGSETKRTL